MPRSLRVLVPLATALVLSSCTESTGPAECSGGTEIKIGESRSGSLSAGDDVDSEYNAYLDKWAFRVSDEQEIVIAMNSMDFDTYLRLLDEDNEVVAFDDDSGDDFNSRIVEVLPAGCYVIEATSFDAGETGSYSISVGN